MTLGLPSMHAEDVALLHDEQVLAVDLDLGARPLAEQHAVAGLDVEGVASCRSRRGRRGRRRLLRPRCGFSLAVSGMMMPPGGLYLFLEPLDDDTVVQRPEFH